MGESDHPWAHVDPHRAESTREKKWHTQWTALAWPWASCNRAYWYLHRAPEHWLPQTTYHSAHIRLVGPDPPGSISGGFLIVEGPLHMLRIKCKGKYDRLTFSGEYQATSTPTAWHWETHFQLDHQTPTTSFWCLELCSDSNSGNRGRQDTSQWVLLFECQEFVDSRIKVIGRRAGAGMVTSGDLETITTEHTVIALV